MDDCSKDLISGLPDNHLCQILSNLSTKEAALTSLLSKRWRDLFVRTPNLDFDDFSSIHQLDIDAPYYPPDQTHFIAFVDRVLTLRGEHGINKFSVRCGDGVEKVKVSHWILKVLRLCVSDLTLLLFLESGYVLPSEIFVSKTLVRLTIRTEDKLIIKLRNVCLPKLRTLRLDSLMYAVNEIDFAKLLWGCLVLEELILINLAWHNWESCSLCIPSLKRLTFCCVGFGDKPKSISFDTPNVVHFVYSDTIAGKYPKVNFDSLVEASIGIEMNYNEVYISESDEEIEMVGNATDLLMGIRNVKTLYVSAATLEILTSFCEAVPMFNNLTHLTIESNPKVGWESLPDLLNNCSNLETLVFQGLLHKETDRCGDVCLCQSLKNNSSCLLSSSVKFLKILKFGESNDDENKKKEMDQIKHFLEKMPNLEQLIIYYNTLVEDDLVEVSNQIQKVAHQLKCKIQVLSDNFSASSALHISLLMKYGLLL